MLRIPIIFILLLSAFLIIQVACGESEAPTSEVKTETNVPKPKAQPVLKTTNKLGKRMFLLCTACHSLKKGVAHKTGPNLHGIFGSKAAMKPGFAYSEQLKKSDITWNENNMREWLKDPAQMIPGTAMAFVGIPEEEKMTALIEFLKEQTK